MIIAERAEDRSGKGKGGDEIFKGNQKGKKGGRREPTRETKGKGKADEWFKTMQNTQVREWSNPAVAARILQGDTVLHQGPMHGAGRGSGMVTPAWMTEGTEPGININETNWQSMWNEDEEGGEAQSRETGRGSREGLSTIGEKETEEERAKQEETSKAFYESENGSTKMEICKDTNSNKLLEKGVSKMNLLARKALRRPGEDFLRGPNGQVV